MALEKKSDIVQVKPEEAALVKRANDILRESWEVANKEAADASIQHNRQLKAAAVFIENPDDQRIVAEYDRLAQKYKTEKGLTKPPVLIPPLMTQPFNPQMEPAFHRYQRKESGPLSQIALVDLFIDRVPLCRWNDSLHVWNGTHYTQMSDNALRGLIKEVLREELLYTSAASTINAILTLLQSERRIRVVSGAVETEIALANGAVNLDTLCLHPASPEVFNTHYLDSSWYGKTPCPVFQDFIWSVSGGDAVLCQRILETIGFLLSPGNEAKRFVLFQGVPNSGKSVLGRLIQSFFVQGDFSSLPLHQFGDRFGMSALAGRHLNVSMDLPDGVIESKAAATLKQITGGDQVFVEEKGKEGRAKQIQCKLLFGTNHPVVLKQKDAAFANRLLLIPFRIPVPPEQMDVTLLEKLLQEKPGVLYEALSAYRGVARRNYQFTGEDRFGFKLQEIIQSPQPAESVRAFVKQCCQPGPESFLTVERLHQAFEAFCCQKGLPGIADRAAFSRALHASLGEQIKPDKRRVGGVSLNGYVGIKFQNGGN